MDKTVEVVVMEEGSAMKASYSSCKEFAMPANTFLRTIFSIKSPYFKHLNIIIL
jgi:hypothetical protein